MAHLRHLGEGHWPLQSEQGQVILQAGGGVEKLEDGGSAEKREAEGTRESRKVAREVIKRLRQGGGPGLEEPLVDVDVPDPDVGVGVELLPGVDVPVPDPAWPRVHRQFPQEQGYGAT